ncbi:damage-control phosphatase ARMT1-like [Atheta coriaria]|uniref:damage-control phosphatase ARMT1-like n=1 Tax=Dalotia coriaria TaxID=877792 RepID=UPI0031F45CC0
MSTNDEDIEICNCSKLLGSCLDIVTPKNEKLSAYYKRSFAHYTVKSRLPVILTKLIDSLARSKQDILEIYGKESLDELKTVIGEISKLKYELQTNKQVAKLESNTPDAKAYNIFIKKSLDQNCQCSYYNVIWLFAECFMYRRIFEIFIKTDYLQEFDYFAKYKQSAFESTQPLMSVLGGKLIELTAGITPESPAMDRDGLKSKFVTLLKLNLWGNKCDLSLSLGKNEESQTSFVDDLGVMDTNILCDQSDEIYAALCRDTMFEVIDFVCDNAGYELFTDFCLADFLITHQYARQIRFFVKQIPWFISDVMPRDISWILETLANSEDKNLRNLSEKWLRYFDTKLWVVEESYFWTTYLPFSQMLENDEQLYKKLSRSKCTFYKGDLNYRKLLGDRNWDPVTPFEDALEGYHPSRLCSLRTLKADLICGLREGLAQEMEEKDPEWLTSGEYGVIQYSDKVTRV